MRELRWDWPGAAGALMTGNVLLSGRDGPTLTASPTRTPSPDRTLGQEDTWIGHTVGRGAILEDTWTGRHLGRKTLGKDTWTGGHLGRKDT